MEVIEFNSAIYRFHVDKHKTINTKILKDIQEMGRFTYENNQGQKISHSDWHLSKDYPRPYIDKLMPELVEAFKHLNVHDSSFWFQQYLDGDYHSWHKHGYCTYSSVYFVELPNTVETIFRNHNGDGFTVQAQEGDFIVFPSHLEHCSPENNTKHRKTIISINLNTN